MSTVAAASNPYHPSPHKTTAIDCVQTSSLVWFQCRVDIKTELEAYLPLIPLQLESESVVWMSRARAGPSE